MANKKRNRADSRLDVAYKNYEEAYYFLYGHPLFSPLMRNAYINRGTQSQCPPDGWAVVASTGVIHLHPTRRASAEEWSHIIAHCLLHLAFGHFKRQAYAYEWNLACDYFIHQFLGAMKLGAPLEKFRHLIDIPASTEEGLYRYFCEQGIPPELISISTAGERTGDMIFIERPAWNRETKWAELFAEGLKLAVTSAVNVAAGVEKKLGNTATLLTSAQMAKNWFLSSYPLLGALAASFEIIEDPNLCARMSISIAAVDPEAKEIYINANAGLDDKQCRFVIAHELLHVGLRHAARRMGRDAYLWNIACDFVINGWLVEMGIGDMPPLGALYDPDLKGMSAEAIYDLIVTDMRRYRKLATLRGLPLGDILERGIPEWWKFGAGIALDDLYRRCLGEGLVYHEQQGRGYLPAGLIEEIRALSQPPIPWDVELAQWFDNYFSPLEKRRSYARPSRRQSATPDIPRPRWVAAQGAEDGRTFGVVLDTSGSMDRALLAKALGAIASYSISREVPAVRVIFCDAVAYDQGYMSAEAIAERVKVKGRGGTILQPGVDLLERAEDFPQAGPILVITDGLCDHVRIRREHAFLIPAGACLPFAPRGKVFRIS